MRSIALRSRKRPAVASSWRPAASASSSSARWRSSRRPFSVSSRRLRSSSASAFRSSTSASRLSIRSSSAAAMRLPKLVELVPELLGALRGGRLEREGAQSFPHLVLEISSALRLDLDAGELQLRPVAAPLELAEARCLLDERAPLRRLRGEDLLDAALPDDGVHLPAEPDVGEHLDDVGAAHVRAVDEVLALAAAVKPACDRELRELQRPVAVLVVEEELHLGERGADRGCSRPRRGRRRASRREARSGSGCRRPRRSRRRRSTCPTRSARRRRRHRARGAPRPDPETT